MVKAVETEALEVGDSEEDLALEALVALGGEALVVVERGAHGNHIFDFIWPIFLSIASSISMKM